LDFVLVILFFELEFDGGSSEPLSSSSGAETGVLPPLEDLDRVTFVLAGTGGAASDSPSSSSTIGVFKDLDVERVFVLVAVVELTEALRFDLDVERVVFFVGAGAGFSSTSSSSCAPSTSFSSSSTSPSTGAFALPFPESVLRVERWRGLDLELSPFDSPSPSDFAASVERDLDFLRTRCEVLRFKVVFGGGGGGESGKNGQLVFSSLFRRSCSRLNIYKRWNTV
jgi:hypothetical protein